MQNLVDMNKACLLNLGWKYKNGENYVSCQVIKVKYARNNNQNKMETKIIDSSLRENIVNIWPGLQEMTMWSIVNGEIVGA